MCGFRRRMRRLFVVRSFPRPQQKRRWLVFLVPSPRANPVVLPGALDGDKNPSKYAATETPAHFAAMLGRPGKDCDFDAIPKKCAKTRVLERPVLQSRRRSASLPAPKNGPVTTSRPSWCIDRDHQKNGTGHRDADEGDFHGHF